MRQRISLLWLLLAIIVVLAGANACPIQQDSQPLNLPEEDTLRLFDTGPLTLDPALSQEIGSHTYIMHIFSGLVSFNQELNLIPDIAERWELSNQNKTYTFYLRRGVKFHNGREVKAEDFKYSWERAAAPKTQSPTTATYLGDIVGVKEVLAGTATQISGVKVLGDYTLEVTIDAPKVYFLAKLSYPVAFAVDKANVDSGKEWWRQPNGTGPFKLKNWRKDEFIVLERNESYYREKAKVSYVLFKLWGGIPMNMYEMGDIDITYVSLADLERVTDETNPLHLELVIVPELSIFYLGFNIAQPPFDDAKVRQAFSLAIDKDRVINQVLKRTVIKAEGILPPDMPGYDKSLRGFAYDVDRAQELIAESTYGSVSNFPSLIFTTSGEGNALSDVLTTVICQWKHNLGVEIEVRQLEPQAYYRWLEEEKDNFFDFGWVADYPDPQNFLEVLFHSKAKYNIGDYDSPEVDALLEQASIEQDNSHRLGLYQEIEQKIVGDAAVLPLWFGQNYVLVKPYVKGFAFSPLGVPLLSQISLEPH